MTDMLTLITVTIVNSDGETEASSGCYDPSNDPRVHGTVESITQETKEAAIDRFNEQGYGGLKSRTIVSITTLPKPTMVATTVKAELPEQAEDGSGDTVTTTVS